MSLYLPSMFLRSGSRFPERSFYIFLKTEYQLQNAYFLVFNIKILKNILKMKYSSINPFSTGHNILSWKLVTAL